MAKFIRSIDWGGFSIGELFRELKAKAVIAILEDAVGSF
jgi:hypothetical protein